MATIKQYARNLWQVQRSVAQKLGVNIAWSQPDLRVVALSSDVCLATLIKVLTDKGVVTDPELQTAFNAVLNADFPKQTSSIPAPDENGDVPDPDLGA